MRNLAVLFTGSFLMLVGVAACVPITTPPADARSGGAPEPTCETLGPSTDPDATARVGALFSRPENVAQLLQNLKLAYDKDLFLQPGFYDDANLTKFFAGTTVTWEESRPISTKDTVMQRIVVTADSSVLPQVTITLGRKCWIELRYVPPNHYQPERVKKAAGVLLRVGATTGFMLGSARGVFGPASRQEIDRGLADDAETGMQPTTKGSVFYENPEKRIGGIWGIPAAKATFVVKLDLPPTSEAERRQQAGLNDSDSLDEIRIDEVER